MMTDIHEVKLDSIKSYLDSAASAHGDGSKDDCYVCLNVVKLLPLVDTRAAITLFVCLASSDPAQFLSACLAGWFLMGMEYQRAVDMERLYGEPGKP